MYQLLKLLGESAERTHLEVLKRMAGIEFALCIYASLLYTFKALILFPLIACSGLQHTLNPPPSP